MMPPTILMMPPTFNDASYLEVLKTWQQWLNKIQPNMDDSLKMHHDNGPFHIHLLLNIGKNGYGNNFLACVWPRP